MIYLTVIECMPSKSFSSQEHKLSVSYRLKRNCCSQNLFLWLKLVSGQLFEVSLLQEDLQYEKENPICKSKGVK